MLVLTRKVNQSIIIGDGVEVKIIGLKGNQVKLGIKAPRSLRVDRKEVYLAIQQENLAATRAAEENIKNLGQLEFAK